MATTIGGMDAASKGTNHVAVGPPAVSNIPPMTPATPPGVPAPFPYVAMSSSAAQTAPKTIIAGGDALVQGSAMTVIPPGNMPSQPAPIHDLVTQMVNQKVVVT
jgi:hypothetical protein